MDDRLEQLIQITKISLNELQEARDNCEKYSFNIMLMKKELNTNRRDYECFLAEYDSFLSNITSIMDAARKFNIYLNLCGMKMAKINNLSLNKQGETADNDIKYTETSKAAHFPAEEYEFGIETFEDFVYPMINLNLVYKPNDVINGTVTYIKIELSKSLELRQYHTLPPKNKIFGCVLDNQIFRAVLSSKSFYDDEMNEEIFPCYLLDTGEILPLKRDFIMYKLTDEQAKIPALALPCQLLTRNKNPFKKSKKHKLKDIEYKKCSFKIISIENNILKVDILDNINKESPKTASEDHAIDSVENEIKSNKTKQLQLTEEELEMIYDEPLSTSNAMKAVMGYDPQDDKRICRFYDPLTGGCFKGVNCRLEHTLRQPDGWTKDVLPASSIVDSRRPITIFTAGSIINITPTYVGQIDRFYAQINEPNKNFHPLIWNDEDVPSRKLMRKPPHMFELVLCRYVDGLWYRAKIMSHDDEYKWFKVLYVDYGNVQVVHLQNIATIEHSTAALPFKAVLCRFQNANEKSSLSIEQKKTCIEILCEMILNKTMDVKVISHYEDLFISFENKKDYPLPDLLIEMGFLDRSENKILL